MNVPTASYIDFSFGAAAPNTNGRTMGSRVMDLTTIPAAERLEYCTAPQCVPALFTASQSAPTVEICHRERFSEFRDRN